jgi:hypothetical protein
MDGLGLGDRRCSGGTVEVGFQGAELPVPALEEVAQGEEGKVVDTGTGEARPALLIWLSAGDPPFQPIKPVFSKAVSEV